MCNIQIFKKTKDFYIKQHPFSGISQNQNNPRVKQNDKTYCKGVHVFRHRTTLLPPWLIMDFISSNYVLCYSAKSMCSTSRRRWALTLSLALRAPIITVLTSLATDGHMLPSSSLLHDLIFELHALWNPNEYVGTLGQVEIENLI